MTTPHPTDALPLPEPFAALSDDETPALYKRWADQIRAARREGFELAMGKLANQTCVHSRSGGMMHKELIANLKDWASDADAHRKQMVPVHRDTLRRIAAALAVPAQEQPISKTDADYWLSIRPGLIDALAARGLQIVSNKDGVRVVEQQQAGAASASLLADALRKLLARTSGEHYPVEQELARTALSSHDDAFRQECDDADELLRMLGLGPDSCRTDGGFINMPRVRSLLIDRNPYGVLSELLACFDLPYPPETAGRDAQSAWGDRRAAAKEQARAVLALKSGGVV